MSTTDRIAIILSLYVIAALLSALIVSDLTGRPWTGGAIVAVWCLWAAHQISKEPIS